MSHFHLLSDTGFKQSLLSVHKPTTLVTQNVILIGSLASKKNLFIYVGGVS